MTNYLDKLAAWAQAQQQAAYFKDEEMRLRRELCSECYADQSPGTHYIDLPNGWKLKAVFKLDQKLDEAALPAVLQAMRDKGVTVTDSLVKYRPELVNAAYKTLDDVGRELFSDALVVKPASPTLALVPPKNG